MKNIQHPSDSYADLSDIYDEFKGYGVPDQDFLKRVWMMVWLSVFGYAKEKGPLLDLGCGTGFLLTLLAKEGYQVTGIDVSEKMLEKARMRARAAGVKVDFVCQDIKQLSLNRRFGAITSKETFAHLLSVQDVSLVLRLCYEHLDPGGTLFFEASVPYWFEKHCRGGRLDLGRFVWEYSGRYDPLARVADMRYDFIFKDGNKISVPFTFRAHDAQEFAAALKEAGFSDIAFYDSDFKTDIQNGKISSVAAKPVSPETRSFVCGARKPAQER